MTNENSEYSFTMMDDGPGVKMVVIGTGGMGNNAIENLAKSGISGLDLYSLNTDVQPLRRCRGSKPVQIGAKRTKGKGAGGDSEIGRLSAEDDAEKIRRIVQDAELVFIASGMGGGTGTGSAPVIARICREIGVLTVCVVSMPMDCEGPKRSEKARIGLTELRKYVDTLLIIENENLSVVMDNEDISIIEVFRRADKVVVDVVTAVAKIINSNGYINLDLADLKKVLQRQTNESCVDAFIGVGEAYGPDRALVAAENALNNPLMRAVTISGATNLLVNVVGSDQLGHNEAMSAIKIIVERAGNQDREIFMGVVPDNTMGDKLSITIIATGLSTKNSNVVSINGIIKQREISVSEKHGTTPSRNIMISPISDSSLLNEYASGSVDEMVALSVNKSSSSGVDGFGFSPMIRKDEWLTPAYKRNRNKEFENYRSQVVSQVHESCVKGGLAEVGSLVGKHAEDRLQYKQPLCSIAG